MIDPRPFTDARRSHRRSRWSVVLVSGIFLATWTSCARAQINPFRGYKGPTLSKEDLATGRAAANKLLTEDQAQVGKSEDWAGPTSGHTGSISVERAFRRQGMDCRSLRSRSSLQERLRTPKNVQPERMSPPNWRMEGAVIR
jgi:hypothetical protein